MRSSTLAVQPCPSEAELMREPSQPAPASVPELRAPSEQGSQRVAEAASLRRKSTTKQMEAIVQNARGAGNEAVRKTKEQL
eukprot:6429210-Prymnesium_polylepis.2